MYLANDKEKAFTHDRQSKLTMCGTMESNHARRLKGPPRGCFHNGSVV